MLDSMSRGGRRAFVVAGVVLIVAIGSGLAASRGRDRTPAPLTVTWGGSEGHPSCAYNPADHNAVATIKIDGRSRHSKVLVTVTAYADENTSELVGTGSRSVALKGSMHTRVLVTIPVDRAPHLDDDGIAACRLAVKY